MTNQHPKAIEAQQKAADRQQLRAIHAANVAHAKQAEVRFYTVGDATYAYRMNRRNVIEFATAVRHPNDKPDKLTAQAMAGTRFMNGQRIALRIQVSPRAFFNGMFLASADFI